jgi:hypothetical protein
MEFWLHKITSNCHNTKVSYSPYSEPEWTDGRMDRRLGGLVEKRAVNMCHFLFSRQWLWTVGISLNVTPCGLVETYQRSRENYYFLFQGRNILYLENGGSRPLRNIVTCLPYSLDVYILYIISFWSCMIKLCNPRNILTEAWDNFSLGVQEFKSPNH